MILTGDMIQQEIESGIITISPFDPKQVNPNSYNYRLGKKLRISHFDARGEVVFEDIEIPEDGLVLEPQRLYLGHTLEVIGSSKYATSLIGRSSLGRLGLFLQVSANLGHTFSRHSWTLEIFAAKAIRVYPLMKIGQVSFWQNQGELHRFPQRYAKFNSPMNSFGIPLASRESNLSTINSNGVPV